MSERHLPPTKKQRDALRERMLGAGRTRQAIAEEMSRRWGYRPRLAWRYAHGWSQETAADMFNQRHDDSGRAPMSGTRVGAYERWPGSGERPGLRLLRGLAEVYGTTLDHLVDEHDLAHLPEPDRLLLLDIIGGRPAPPPAAEPEMRVEPATTYGQGDACGYADPEIEYKVVVMAAHEGSEHAEQAERRDIGEATLEQFRADVTRLAHDYLTGDPFPLFQEMRRVRGRMYAALDRRLWPRDETELYLMLGALNGLMANAAQDLGYSAAAEELLRSGWAYAIAIDHRPLMGKLRSTMSSVAYWQNRPRQARDLALSGLRYLPEGQGAARLYLQNAQACAKLGDLTNARQAIEAAHTAAARPYRDEIHDDLGGQFACPPDKRAYLAGNALIEDRGSQRDAITELRRAAELFAATPAEERSYGCEAIAHINLSRALIRTGELDAVDLSPVFGLPVDKRIDALPKALTGIRTELADQRYRGEPRAIELDEQIELFSRETIVHDLHELPSAST
jgi:transcriptional regulator with XRE-family HTH domain